MPLEIRDMPFSLDNFIQGTWFSIIVFPLLGVMITPWSNSVYKSPIIDSMPLKDDNNIIIAAEITITPITEIRVIMVTAWRLFLENKYLSAM